MTNQQTRDPVNLVERLVTINQSSEKNLYTAAEQMENRATKLLLKAYAQQRAEFARQLEQSLHPDPASQPGLENDASAPVAERAPATSPGFLQRGWVTLRSGLTVQRRGRQRAAIQEVLSTETDVLQRYDQAMNRTDLDESMQILLAAQSKEIHTAYEYLRALTEQTEDQLVLRLFNQEQEAEQVVQRLADQVPQRERIATIPIEQVPVYDHDDEERTHSTREAIVTGGLFGAIFGAILGAIYGVYHWLALSDVLPGILANSAAGVIWELALYGAIIGLFFSIIFSSLITRNTAEADEYLYEQGLRQGDILVAVVADKDKTASIRRAIGIKHEHEVEPVPA